MQVSNASAFLRFVNSVYVIISGVMLIGFAFSAAAARGDAYSFRQQEEAADEAASSYWAGAPKHY